MDYRQFLQKIPKAELHIHLNGTLRATTLIELAAKHGVPLPTTDPESIYHFPYTDFFGMLQIASSVVRDADDFSRITYESLEDGVKHANLKYREMFFNPTLFPSELTYPEMLDAMIDGVESAESDYGVRCNLIPCIYRGESAQQALEMVEAVIANRRDQIVGIGMDGPEAHGPPERFVEAFQLAGKAGLGRTAHSSEDGPPENTVTCLDLLGCDRIDHGYSVLEDLDLVARMRDEGIFFNVIIRAWAKYTGFNDHPVKEMVKRGLRVTIGSDDPPIQHGNLGLEYVDAAYAFNWGAEKMIEICMNGIDASWLDDDEKRRMRADFTAEINAMLADDLDNLPKAFFHYFRGPWWSVKLDLRNLKPVADVLKPLQD